MNQTVFWNWTESTHTELDPK